MDKSKTPALTPPTPENEFQALLDSLPKGIGPVKETLCLYKGHWYSPEMLQLTMAFRQQFQARASDIILVTLPKSGTTWLKYLVFAITNRSRYPISDPNHPLLTNNSHALVPFLHEVKKLPIISSAPSPRILFAHSPYSMLPESVKNSNCRIIYLCRNPKDVFASSWYFGKTLPEYKPVALGEFFDRFCEGVTWFGPCWDHALEFWKLSLARPEVVLFMRYEDLKGDMTSQLKKMAEHLGFPFSHKEESEGVIEDIVRLCSFEHLKNLEVNNTGSVYVPMQLENRIFFRKGEVGDWKNILTPTMAEHLDQVLEIKLQGSGLTFP